MGKYIRKVVLGIMFLFALFGVLVLIYWGCSESVERHYSGAVPPKHVQTFDDFVAWQTEIQFCRQVEVRGMTYYHVIGPYAGVFVSGGALYVFDAKGNFVGWAECFGDVLCNHAIFYPKFWLPDDSTVTDITYDELKRKISIEFLESTD